jgi:hypothetical protein
LTHVAFPSDAFTIIMRFSCPYLVLATRRQLGTYVYILQFRIPLSVPIIVTYLITSMGTGSLPGVKRPGRDADHTPPSSAEVT